jgi:thioredoxin-like negative regulator of GroEL
MEIGKISLTDSVLLKNISFAFNSAEKIESQSMSLSLSEEVDESSELFQKESVQDNKTNEYGIKQTDTENFEQDVINSTGTVYVVIGNLPECSTCRHFEDVLANRKDEVEAKAQVFNIQRNDNRSLCTDIMKQCNSVSGYQPCSFPIVVKYVDGQLKEVISDGAKMEPGHDYKRAKFDIVIQDMLDKAEGTPPVREVKIKEDNSKSKVELNETKETMETEQKDLSRRNLKQKLANIKESLNIAENLVQTISSNSLESAIERASSIDELQTAVKTYSTGLDFSIQINLSLVVNNFSADTDLNAAKEQLLAIL